jgi:hypothetical protein
MGVPDYPPMSVPDFLTRPSFFFVDGRISWYVQKDREKRRRCKELEKEANQKRAANKAVFRRKN